MARLIDADKADRRIRQFLCGGCDDYHNCGNCLANKALSLLSGEQTVDAEPVVRCKDCKFASLTYDGECKYCQRWKEKYDGESVSLYLDGDFYCAWGERREDAETN